MPRDLSSDERGTPRYIVDAARRVMGEIDLDPASCAMANEGIQAKVFYTRADDGLLQPWFGKVWLNPPFSQPTCEQFIDKLLQELDTGNVKEAIVLTNYSTGRWFHKLLRAATVVAFIRHHPMHPNARLEFYPLPGNNRGMMNNSTGQVLFYFGGRPIAFYCEFEKYCTIMWQVRRE